MLAGAAVSVFVLFTVYQLEMGSSGGSSLLSFNGRNRRSVEAVWNP